MKKIVLGILAHVDAGKTTLNECFLYHGKVIRKLGRVDNRDSYLDYDEQERERGITIYTKNARFHYLDSEISLLDTPGHTDFSGEMERVLQVLDAALLLINGQNGVQSHTRTIFRLCAEYHIPLFVFVNKMDITVLHKEELLADLEKHLDGVFIDLSMNKTQRNEKLALVNEDVLNEYLRSDDVSDETLRELIANREIFPVYFGSALKDEGIKELLEGLNAYCPSQTYSDQLGLRIFKVAYDDNNNRLLYAKVTGGKIANRQKIAEQTRIDQLFLMNGRKFEAVEEAYAGDIVAIKGLETARANDVIGAEKGVIQQQLGAYMNYRIVYDQKTDTNLLMKELHKLEEEYPEIHVRTDGYHHEIYMQLLGDLQIDVIRNIMKKRMNIDISFDNGTILYKETIRAAVTGVGHYEPLRHYAEVHVLLEPLKRNSGLEFASSVATDDLSLNWQRLILTHMQEKEHTGVLINAPITDMRLTLKAGRAHLKHTEGGDFREATYRAIRQGLKKAESVLLEPYFSFVIETDKNSLSRILYDLENQNTTFSVSETEDLMMIRGEGPVVNLQNYHSRLASLSSGNASITLTLSGYQECHNTAEVLQMFDYDSEADVRNPTGSVFCAHGAGFYVPYNHVEEYMHIREDERGYGTSATVNRNRISEEELKKVFLSAGGRNRNQEKVIRQQKKTEEKPEKVEIKIKEKKPEMVLVDGYNVMRYFAVTKDLSEENFEMAREIIIKQLSDYAAYKGCSLVAVFDAYKVEGGTGSVFTQEGIRVVFTRQYQTADSYIEKAVHDYHHEYDIVVVSSDYALQNMIFTSGARRMSAREMENELAFLKTQAGGK